MTIDARLSAPSQTRPPPFRGRGLAFAAWMLPLFLACDRPPQPDALSVVFSNADLALVNAAMADGIAQERPVLTTGRREYAIVLPGYPRPITLTFDLRERTLQIPFGTARVKLNDIPIRQALLRWNPAQNALQLQIDMEDKEDGLLANIRALGIVQDASFAVISARINCYLTPRIDADGGLDFEPVRAELLVNTDDTAPDVRDTVRSALRQVQTELTQQANASFVPLRADLTAFVRSQLAPNTTLTRIQLAASTLTFLAERAAVPEDLNGDGKVDIIDLVRIAQSFGQEGGIADVNGDGVVNIADLVLVARRFGQ